jgi:hypothetical protein
MLMGSGCVDPHFHDLGTSWRWVVSFTPRSRFPRERAPGTHWIEGWVDLKADLDDFEKRQHLTLPGLELRPLGNRAPYLIAIRTALPWLLMSDGKIKKLWFERRQGIPRFYLLLISSWVFFFPLALQSQFGPWPTSLKPSVSHQFTTT